jgi:hypothetical protein
MKEMREKEKQKVKELGNINKCKKKNEKVYKI